MADPQTPNTPSGDEFSDDAKNEAIARLLERLRRIDATETTAAAQRTHPQRPIAPSMAEKPPETPPTAARIDEPSKYSAPPPQEPIESDPLPINTRYEHMQNLRRARQQQVRATRRQAWKDLQRQTRQHLTRAVDFSNRWVNRLVSFVAGVGVTCLVLLLIQLWVASTMSNEITPTQPEALHLSGVVPTTTPPPTLSVIWRANANPTSPMSVIPPHTHPDIIGCWVSAENIEISPNTPYDTQDEPTLRLWTQVDTEGCEGRLLRVSLSITRSDGQPLPALGAWQFNNPTNHQLTVEGKLSISDGSPVPIVLELPHTRFPLAPGLHSLSGYLNIRDENTDMTLYDMPLEPFILPIAP
ncbi:MAG: hypothetical protein MUF38_05990 [Anaerolineae bacterium]|nr:hypothetical protein [Anaerolineae bacterium]